MYCFQNPLSAMSALPNFQFLSVSSMRARNRSLFFFGEVEKERDDAGLVLVEVSFQIRNRTMAVVPDRLLVVGARPTVLAAQNLGVHADGQHPPRNRIG